MNLNTVFDEFTKLKDWWKIVKDNFQEVQEEHNAEVEARGELSSDVSNHKASHGSSGIYGHVRLSDSYIINGGVNNGIAATPNAVSSAYNSAIEASKGNAKSYDEEEAAKRKAADNTLQANIDAESETRKEADDDLRTGIGNLYNILGSINEELTARATILRAEASSIEGCDIDSGKSGLRDKLHEVDFLEITNDKENNLTQLWLSDDDKGCIILSEAIPPQEKRICKILKFNVAGAESEDGYMWVMPRDNSLQESISDEISARETADDALDSRIAELFNLLGTLSAELDEVNA